MRGLKEFNYTDIIDPICVPEYLVSHCHREWLNDGIARLTFCARDGKTFIARSKVLILRSDLVQHRCDFAAFVASARNGLILN